jgi:hypothetical protein
MASAATTPSDEELRAAAISLKGDNPLFGVARLRTLLLQDNPTWALSEGRLKKILHSEGLINKQQTPSTGGVMHPSSQLIEDLDIEKWTHRIEVKVFDKSKGKGLVAKEKIVHGDTIWKEDPFIIAPEWYWFRALASQTKVH